MKKKVLTVMLSLTLALSICACGNKEAAATAVPETTEQPAEETAETVVEEETARAESEAEAKSEAETESEKPEASAAAAKKPAGETGLSEDVYSFQMSYNGDFYQFPMSFKEFQDLGWTFQDGDELTELDSYVYAPTTVWKNGQVTCYAGVYNLETSTTPVEDCYIGGITLEAYYLKDDSVEIILPGGIQYGISTSKDVEAAYGTPSDTYESDSLIKWTYTYDYDRQVELCFNVDTDVIEKIDMENMIDPAQAGEAAAKSGESVDMSQAPEVVSLYEAPTEVGDDLYSFAASFDGDLYRLPAPVSVFLENGWKIQTEDSDATVAGKRAGRITLSKNNQKFRASVRNYDKNEQPAEFCYLISLKASTYEANVPMELPCGIVLGTSTKEDVESALEGYNFETEDNTSSTYYDVFEDSKGNSVEIYVNKESGVVNTIEMSNDLKELK